MKRPRIGLGEDIHRFAPNRELVLGGVHIPYELGLDGHSDADVLYHALADAILGAMGLRDIGFYFPVNDSRYDNLDSSLIVKKAVELMEEKGYEVGNVDCLVQAEAPKLSPYIASMKKNIASLLKIEESEVGLQAGTNEGLDAIGQKKGIRCSVSVLLFPKGA